MDKILTHEGGQPLYLDDITFMDKAIRESFGGLLRMFGNDQNVYLTNLNVVQESPGVVRWDAGYIALSGEILPVLAGSITVNPALPLYWHVAVSNALNSNRVFDDGIARDCLEVRTATLNTTGEGGFPETGVTSVHDAILSMLEEDFQPKIKKIQLSSSGNDKGLGYITYAEKKGIKSDFHLYLTAFYLSQVGEEQLTRVVNGERILREIPCETSAFGINEAYLGSACHVNGSTGAITTYQAIAFAKDGKAYLALRNQNGVPLESFTFGTITISVKLGYN